MNVNWKEVFLNLDDVHIGNRFNRRKELSKYYDFCIAAFEHSQFILRVQNDKVECIPADIKYISTKWFELREGETIVPK